MRLRNPFTAAASLLGNQRPLTARTAITGNAGGAGSNYGSTTTTAAAPPPKTPPVPVPTLKDPTQPRIDVSPGDLLDAPLPPSIDDKRLYDFVVNKCWKPARDARTRWERDWKLSLEFYGGNQWVGWDAKNKRWKDYATTDPDPLRFSTTNLIRPRIETVASMVTQSAIISECDPMTPSDLDRQAAVEARGIIGNYNDLFSNKVQTREAVDWALTSTTIFLKSVFVPGKAARIPKFAENADGSRALVGATMGDVGDIDETLVPGFKIYGDPCGNKISRWRWLIHAEVYPLSWFQENFENGYSVRADPGGGVVSYAAGGSAGISASYGVGTIGATGTTGDGTVNKDAATCYEMWILPGRVPTFPLGAVIYCAGGQVLVPRKRADGSSSLSDSWANKGIGTPQDGGNGSGNSTRGRNRIPGNYHPWPYECTTEFPFIDLSYDDNPDSAYGRSLVQDLIEPQQDYNRTRTRIRERLEKEKIIWQYPKLGLTGSERWEDYGNYVKVPFDPEHGGAGQFVQPSEIGQQQFGILELIQHNMDDIAGIHDPNFRGSLPEGVKSGVAIQALKQGDSSRLSRFGNRIEQFVKRRDEWRIRHAAQYFGEDRLMGMDDTGNASRRTPADVSQAPVPPQLAALNAAPPMTPPAMGAPSGAAPAAPSNFATAPNAGMPPLPASAATQTDAGAPHGSDSGRDLGYPGEPPTGVTPTSNPYANVMAFKALTQGGQVRIKIEPGSALAETPDARNQRALTYYQEQVFGPVGSATAARTFGQIIEGNVGDIILQRADELEAKEQAELAANTTAPPAPPPPPPDPFALASHQSGLKIQEQKAQIDAETAQKIALLRAERELDREFGPKASLTLKGDAAGTTAAQEEIFGEHLHEAAGHIAGAAMVHPQLGAVHGVAPLPPPPVDPNEGEAGGKTKTPAKK